MPNVLVRVKTFQVQRAVGAALEFGTILGGILFLVEEVIDHLQDWNKTNNKTAFM